MLTAIQKNQRVIYLPSTWTDRRSRKEYMEDLISRKSGSDEERIGEKNLREYDLNPSRADIRLSHRDLLIEINRSLSTVTHREADIVKMFFGLKGKIYTLEEIGERYNITAQRARQAKEKAIRRLKHKSRNQQLRTYIGSELTEENSIQIQKQLATELRKRNARKKQLQKEGV